MPLSPGDKLGPYEILAPIGAGGMGEVYRAKDTKLDREVAIKVLPSALAQDPERLARFEREAKVLASLNHPNIAQIYGIEESGGVRALVMELVPGATLKGPLPLETALDYAKQIADALEAAHEKGITHRDLKPANIMVTPAGVVKVLDFGLAAVGQASSPGDGNPTNSPTLTIQATQAGMIMGTAGYMRPEQAAGQTVDRRADIWAFGVVLWEMLTGKQLFTGDTVAHILADVLRAPIDFDTLPKETPRTIRDLVKRCLDRDVKNRLQWIGEARIAIQKYLANPTSAPDLTTTARSRSRLSWVVSGAAVLIAAVALWVAWRATRPIQQPLKPLVRLDVDLGSDVSLNAANGAAAILSPDGTRLVYVSQTRLFTRRLDQPKPIELAGTDGAFAPFFSPDGQWVAFFTGGKLKKISVEGGAPITLCDLCDVSNTSRGGSWGEDGNIIAAFNGITGLSRIPSATGGPPAPVSVLAPGEATNRWPQILPGAKAVLFTAHTTTAGFDGASIEVMSLVDHRQKTLVRGGTFGRYLPSGHLVYVNGGTIFAVPFDLDKLEVRGTPIPVLEQVNYSQANGSAQFDFSRTGILVYRSGAGGSGLVTVQWLDRTGKTQPLLAKPGNYLFPRLSPDGQRLAMTVAEGSGQDIWVYDWPRDTMTRLTFDGRRNVEPLWSPDGRYIVFGYLGGTSWMRSDGAGKPSLLIPSKNAQVPWSFTPDGKRLAFMGLNSGAFHLWTVPVGNDSAGLRAGKPEPFLQTSFIEREPSFSPDGHWLAYTSNESGTYQVYVRAFPDQGGKWQISNSSGVYPEWSHTGNELFFRTEDSRMIMVAAYTVKGASFVADKPRLWSDKPLMNLGLARNYDLAPDGKRIAALMPVEGLQAQQAQNQVIFLENFFDELRRKVPTGK